MPQCPAIVAAPQDAIFGKRLDRERHRGAPLSDHVPERVVRKRDRDVDAIGARDPDALGSKPKQRYDALVEAGQLRDRPQNEPVLHMLRRAPVHPPGKVWQRACAARTRSSSTSTRDA
jgi:hypothetical protein